MAPALAFVLAVALGAEARVETGIRTEARVRHLDPAPTPAQKDALDLSATPHLTLGITGGLGSLSLTYSPTVTAADLGPDHRWEHMHEGEARVQLGAGPIWKLEAFANGGIGRTDLITENRNATGETGPGTSTISTVSAVDLMRWRSGASLQLAPDRRTEALFSGAVSEDGGTNDPSRAVRPTERSTELAAELRWASTRTDKVGLRASAAQGRIAERHADSAWANALATWRHRFDPQLELWAGAGAVALRSRLPVDAARPEDGRRTASRYGPAGELGLARIAAPPPRAEELATAGRPRRQDATGRVEATLGASVDRLTGVATPQAEVSGEVRWPLATSTALVGRGTGALLWPDTGRTRRGQLELGASFTITARALVDLGGYGAWQNSSDPGVPDVTEYGAYLRLSLDAPPIVR